MVILKYTSLSWTLTVQNSGKKCQNILTIWKIILKVIEYAHCSETLRVFFIWLSQSWCQDSIPLTLLSVQTIELPDGAGVGKDTLSGPAQPQSSLLGRFSCQSRSSPERNKGILHGDYFPEWYKGIFYKD